MQSFPLSHAHHPETLQSFEKTIKSLFLIKASGKKEVWHYFDISFAE